MHKSLLTDHIWQTLLYIWFVFAFPAIETMTLALLEPCCLSYSLQQIQYTLQQLMPTIKVWQDQTNAQHVTLNHLASQVPSLRPPDQNDVIGLVCLISKKHGHINKEKPLLRDVFSLMSSRSDQFVHEHARGWEGTSRRVAQQCCSQRSCRSMATCKTPGMTAHVFPRVTEFSRFGLI